MTSAINPNNIDGAYPVAGQDNNSQGFRDNFTSTKVNFQFAADEITALQNTSVFTNADNNMNNNTHARNVACMKNGKRRMTYDAVNDTQSRFRQYCAQ